MASSRFRRTMLLLGVPLIAVVTAGALALTGFWSPTPKCPPIIEHPEWTVARRWNEVLLNAIRRDVPAPTVHARNLFHTSAAMWDAWAAFDETAAGIFVDEKHSARDVTAARNEAISYAAFRVLESRYLDSIGAVDTIPEFDRLMEALWRDYRSASHSSRHTDRMKPRGTPIPTMNRSTLPSSSMLRGRP